jgi:hypothetical protein
LHRGGESRGSRGTLPKVGSVRAKARCWGNQNNAMNIPARQQAGNIEQRMKNEKPQTSDDISHLKIQHSCPK